MHENECAHGIASNGRICAPIVDSLFSFYKIPWLEITADPSTNSTAVKLKACKMIFKKYRFCSMTCLQCYIWYEILKNKNLPKSFFTQVTDSVLVHTPEAVCAHFPLSEGANVSVNSCLPICALQLVTSSDQICLSSTPWPGHTVVNIDAWMFPDSWVLCVFINLGSNGCLWPK